MREIYKLGLVAASFLFLVELGTNTQESGCDENVIINGNVSVCETDDNKVMVQERSGLPLIPFRPDEICRTSQTVISSDGLVKAYVLKNQSIYIYWINPITQEYGEHHYPIPIIINDDNQC